MNMSIDKYRFQNRLDDSFDAADLNIKDFQASFVVSNATEYLLREDLKKDSLDYYFKGLLSFVQALNECKKTRYSWATVKLYYSLFYFLRASLAAKGIGFYRKERDLLRLDTRRGSTLQRCYENGNGRRANSDHKATLGLFIELYGINEVDILQSNQIEYLNPYQWLVEKREWINYKVRVFPEPECPDFWSETNKYIKKNKFVNIITDYFNDSLYIYCFQPESACLALPIQRFLQTKKDISLIHPNSKLSKEQIRVINSFRIDRSINQKLLD